MLFENYKPTERLHKVDSLLRVMKEASLKQFRDNAPVIEYRGSIDLASPPQNKLENIVHSLESDYSTFVGKQDKDFWYTFASLLEERTEESEKGDNYLLSSRTKESEKGVNYFLSPEAIKTYHFLTEKYWEQLPPGTRKNLAKAHNFSMGEVLSIKSLTESNKDELLNELKEDIGNYSRISYEYDMLQFTHNKKEDIKSAEKINELNHQRENLRDNIKTKLGVYIYKGNKLKSHLDYAVYEFEGILFRKDVIDEERGRLSRLSWNSRKNSFYKNLFEMEYSEISEAARNDAIELNKLNNDIRNLKIKVKLSEKIDQKYSSQLTVLNNSKRKLTKKLHSVLAMYERKCGGLEEKTHYSKYYHFQNLTFDKEEIDKISREIGLIDLCPVNIGKHYSTIRKGGLFHEFYIPIDVRGNLSIGFPRGKKDLELIISTDSEICGSRVLDNPNYLKDVLTTALKKPLTKDAIRLLDDVKDIGFLKSDIKKNISDPEHLAAWSVLRGRLAKLTVPKDQLEKVLYTAIDVFGQIYPNDIIGKGRRGAASVEILGQRTNAVTLYVDLNQGNKLYKSQLKKLVELFESNDSSEKIHPIPKKQQKSRLGNSLNKFVDRALEKDKRTGFKVFPSYIEKKAVDSGKFSEIPKDVLIEAIGEHLRFRAEEEGWKPIGNGIAYDRTTIPDEVHINKLKEKRKN
ncbi:MAG: hypothetical protein QF568_04895 [Flavobacteriales bacterium]|jgi:hypothetical protein|nr:hypothetical protein [Flavobacteriales bacterium]|tara:strand:- start:6963 stop:9023 length:2061 start_codon:yes stop_codon:yes gene_type:complete